MLSPQDEEFLKECENYHTGCKEDLAPCCEPKRLLRIVAELKIQLATQELYRNSDAAHIQRTELIAQALKGTLTQIEKERDGLRDKCVSLQDELDKKS